MTLITLACVFAGMASGLRFKVLAVLPLMLAAAAATGFAGQDQGTWALLGAIALNTISIQIGYLCGTYAQAQLRVQAAMPVEAPVAPAYKTSRRADASAH